MFIPKYAQPVNPTIQEKTGRLSVSMPVDIQIARTLAIVQQMAQGKQLTLPDYPYPIGMTEDMTVGFIFNGGISQLSEMTLRELNSLLNKHGIGMPIPEVK
jgi:hypothetical protein